MSEREKLIELLGEFNLFPSKMKNVWMAAAIEKLADYLIDNGVCLETKQSTSEKTSNESKRIEELEAELAKKEETVVQLRKQWQEAEMLICTMCGRFDHKTDGNVVCGNRTCGEICGYPYCKAKFTMWIPVSERVPTEEDANINGSVLAIDIHDGFPSCWAWESVKTFPESFTHWMPLPEPPKECE